MTDRARFRYHAYSWLAMAFALALHVFDEAVTEFLPLYNEVAASVREAWWFIPLPVFSFPVWLGGLIAGILLMVALTPLVLAGRRAMRTLSYLLSVVMVFNALGHMGASAYLGRLAPGVLSSPLLLVAALVLFVSTRRVSRSAL